MEARSCNFQTASFTNFGQERLWVLKRSNLPPNFPKMEDYQRQNSTEPAKVARKLRSMAKIARLRENAKIAQKLHSATSQFSGKKT